MTGLHTGDDLFAAIALPPSVQLPCIDRVLGRRTTIDFKPYRDAGVLLVSEPAVPILELTPAIHSGGTEIEQGDAFQLAAERAPIAIARDPYLAVGQNALEAVRPGRVPKPSVEDLPQRLGESGVFHGVDYN